MTPGRPRTRILLIAGLAVALVAGGVLMLTGAARPTTVTVALAETGDVTGRVIATGPVQPAQDLDLTARVSGILEQFDLKEGDPVTAGQVIARLQRGPFEQALAEVQSRLAAHEAALAQLQRKSALAGDQAATRLAAAQAKLTLAKSQLTDRETTAARGLEDAQHALAQATYNMEKLPGNAQAAEQVTYAKTIIGNAKADLDRLAAPDSAARLQVTLAETDLADAQNAIAAAAVLPQEIASARAAVDAARQAVARAQDDLAATAVTAPFDGVVLQAYVRKGAGVTPGMKLITLASAEEALVVANIDESDIDQVKVGQAVKITSPSVADLSLDGKVTRILARATKDTSNATVVPTEIEFTNAGGHLRTGMNADVTIAVAQHTGVVRVPVIAVRTKDSEHYVFVVDGGTIRKRTVATGVKEAHYVEIVDGLKAGEQVVTGPEALMSTLKDGQHVKAGGAR